MFLCVCVCESVVVELGAAGGMNDLAFSGYYRFELRECFIGCDRCYETAGRCASVYRETSVENVSMKLEKKITFNLLNF